MGKFILTCILIYSGWLETVLKAFEIFTYFDPGILLLVIHPLEIMASIQRNIPNESNITYNNEKIRTSQSVTIIMSVIYQGLTKVPDI